MRRPSPLARATALCAALLGGALLVAGCAPDPTGGGSASAGPVATGPTASATSSAPTATATTPPGAVPIPTDCRAILTAGVLAQLEGVPLNDPAFAPVGVQPDGSLICVWGDPAADTTGLQTRITRIDEQTALDQLQALATNEGFTCYTPSGGTRCEKTFPNPNYPVTDGRTLFYRQGVLIDTRFSNLAPDGYTSAIVDAVYAHAPTATPTPTPTPSPTP